MADAKDLEIEISTEGARSLLEIGFDLGVQAAAALAQDREFKELTFEIGEIKNPFRRASTVIGFDLGVDEGSSVLVKKIERVEEDAAANARAHSACACTRERIDLECDLHGVTAEMSEAMRLLEGLSENRRGRVLCWFCSDCHRYVGPGDSCSCGDASSPSRKD